MLEEPRDDYAIEQEINETIDNWSPSELLSEISLAMPTCEIPPNILVKIASGEIVTWAEFQLRTSEPKCEINEIIETAERLANSMGATIVLDPSRVKAFRSQILP